MSRRVITFGTFDVFHVGHVNILERAKQEGDYLIVDEVFVEESLELKADYIQQAKANVLVMGDDWMGKFDDMKKYCEVIYLPRTPSISTTEIIEVVKSL